MKRHPVVLVGLWLVLLVPGLVRAQPRAFDFSGGRRSLSLLEARAPQPPGRVEHNRLRAQEVSTGDAQGDFPLILLLVPILATGGGALCGALFCVPFLLDGQATDCRIPVAVGGAIGLATGLALLGIAIFDPSGLDTCTGSEVDCPTEEPPRAGAPKRLQGREAHRRGGFSLPLTLTPSVGIVNDRAVVGLGGRF